MCDVSGSDEIAFLVAAVAAVVGERFAEVADEVLGEIAGATGVDCY